MVKKDPTTVFVTAERNDAAPLEQTANWSVGAIAYSDHAQISLSSPQNVTRLRWVERQHGGSEGRTYARLRLSTITTSSAHTTNISFL